jgi:hypothetical protein
MKELITEEQANMIILILSIVVTLLSLSYAFYRNRKTPKAQKKLLWLNAFLCALVGPVIWIFWQVYNSIENFYGLDSLKALKINFFIAAGIGIVFYVLFSFAPRFIQEPQVSRRRK